MTVDGRILAAAVDGTAVIVGQDDIERPVRLIAVPEAGDPVVDDGIEIGPRQAHYVFMNR